MQYKVNPNTRCKCSNPKHHAFWILNKKGILSSIERILKTGDIAHLTKDAYNFLYNMSGFIAHYNIDGFKANYQDVRDLVRDIITSSDYSRPEYWRDNFQEDEQHEYYKTKSEIYEALPALINKYENTINTQFSDLEKISDLQTARALAGKYGLSLTE